VSSGETVGGTAGTGGTGGTVQRAGWEPAEGADPTPRALPLAAESVLYVGAAGGVLAAAGAFMPWVTATLRDRGADLLEVHRTGLDLGAAGAAAVALGALAALVPLVAILKPPAVRLLPALPPIGIVIALVTLAKRHAGNPLTSKLLDLRIGTVQTEKPVAHAGVGAGFWLTVAGAALIVLTSAGYLVARRFRRS
jgi:hypothetical protein